MSLPKQLEETEFEKLFKQHFDYHFEPGDIVRGNVVRFDKIGFLIDIGSKQEALLPLKELAKDPVDNPEEVLKIGEERTFYIVRDADDEGENGQLVVSLWRVELANNWEKLAELKKNDEYVEATVSSVVKGGVVVEALGIRGFVPASQIRSGAPYEKLIGKTMSVKILEADHKRNKLILSQRLALAEQRAQLLDEVINTLKVEDIVEGEVVRIVDFGAFIDINGVDGLLPISEISWQRVHHPSDILKIGEKIKVKVLKIDMEQKRISLSLKRMEEDPWVKIETEFKEGDLVDGVVNKLTSFGAFVKIYHGVEALLPLVEIGHNVTSPEGHLAIGQNIKVIIKKFTPREHRISLSLRDVAALSHSDSSV